MVIFQVYFIYDSSSGLGTTATTTSARIVTTTNDTIMLIDILCDTLIIFTFYYLQLKFKFTFTNNNTNTLLQFEQRSNTTKFINTISKEV